MDPQQFLTELDSELRTVLGAFLASTSPASEVTATDESGRVSVTLRPDTTLARVEVAANWEEEIESTQLASTILEVAVSALTGAAQNTTTEDVDPAAVDEARDELLREKTAELMAPMTQDELSQQIDDLPGLLDRLDAQLDDAIEKTSRVTDDDLPREDSGRDDEDALGEIVESENRMVRVQLFHGQLADVRIKESWLEGRSGLAVTECFDQITARIATNTADQS